VCVIRRAAAAWGSSRANLRVVAFAPGDFVERLDGYGTARFGRIIGPIRRGCDSWYVAIGDAITYSDYGTNLRPLLDAETSRHPKR
jgi:hypothetical protein